MLEDCSDVRLWLLTESIHSGCHSKTNCIQSVYIIYSYNHMLTDFQSVWFVDVLVWISLFNYLQLWSSFADSISVSRTEYFWNSQPSWVEIMSMMLWVLWKVDAGNARFRRKSLFLNCEWCIVLRGWT